MHRLSAAALLAFISTIAHAGITDQFAGTYKAVTARAPDAASVLKVESAGATAYRIDLSVVAPNRTHHTGHVEGLAQRAGDTLTLVKPNVGDDGKPDSSGTCILQIRIDGDIAKVVSDAGCAFYHGAGASFVEQGTSLVRE